MTEPSDREPGIRASSEAGPERPGAEGAESGAIVCALVTDLMDRSRLSAAIPGVCFVLVDDANVVIVDLARFADRVAQIRASHPHARIVGFGPHVEDFSSIDADLVLPRSKFFRDPAVFSGPG